MSTDCNEQFTLDIPTSKEVRGQFDRVRLVTDASLSLLSAYEDDRMIFDHLADG